MTQTQLFIACVAFLVTYVVSKEVRGIAPELCCPRCNEELNYLDQ